LNTGLEWITPVVVVAAVRLMEFGPRPPQAVHILLLAALVMLAGFCWRGSRERVQSFSED
jgi:hypothetical protein